MGQQFDIGTHPGIIGVQGLLPFVSREISPSSMLGMSTNILNSFTKAQNVVRELLEFTHELGWDNDVRLFCIGSASELKGTSHGNGAYCLLW